MSRSGYTEECEDNWAIIRCRGAVKSAIRGKRGQAFLREMLAAMDALPEKRLIANELIIDGRPCFQDFVVAGDKLVTESGEAVSLGEVCAIGSVGVARGIDMSEIDPQDTEHVAKTFGISEALAREIVWENDENWYGRNTPEARFERMRKWIVKNLAVPHAAPAEQ